MERLRHKPILRKNLARGAFLIGVIGLAIPILPGWGLIGISLFLFSIDSPELQSRVHRYRTKYLSLDRVLRHSYDPLHKKYAVLEKKIEEVV